MEIMMVLGWMRDKLAEGTRKSVIHLANELVDRGHDVSIATRVERQDSQPELLDDRITVHAVPLRPRGVYAARRLVKAVDPDVVNVHSPSTNMILFWRVAAGKKTLVTFPTFKEDDWKLKGYDLWHPQIQRMVTKTAVTPSIQQRIAGDSTVTPYGIDTKRYTSQQPIDTEDPALFYIGSPYKGLFPACKVLSGLDGPFTFRVAVAPKMSTRDEVEQTIRDHGIWDQTTLTFDYIDDMPGYVNAGDIQLNLLDTACKRTCPPIMTLETMSCGRVPIATDIPEFRGLIEDGENGFRVDNTDYEAIREKIRWLREHPEEARAMGQRARNTVVEQHSISASADTFEDAYRELILSR